jgi:hypothetical protein
VILVSTSFMVVVRFAIWVKRSTSVAGLVIFAVDMVAQGVEGWVKHRRRTKALIAKMLELVA